ncbi:hypothetical protein WILDE_4 [Arthrobacter phage Wilde]|uniref:Uncharacterized protein n=1 Tax=Arthrobacter phage Wilde TaxID=1772323 RepID=A0A0U3TNS7_9CAUD|nr:hypothetical protein WILDE_4 [Arthrobacter phage Wilde]
MTKYDATPKEFIPSTIHRGRKTEMYYLYKYIFRCTMAVVAVQIIAAAAVIFSVVVGK